jgi:hypothetical protein
MNLHSENEAELRRYLLGELEPEEQIAIQERLFLDSKYLLRLQAIEDELVDDYVYDELTTSERERFETHFLSQPGRQDDLRVAKALKSYISSESPSEASPLASRPPTTAKISFLHFMFRHRPVVSFSLAASALLILTAAIWLAVVSVRRENQSHPPVQAQQPAQQQTEPVEGQAHETTGHAQENAVNLSEDKRDTNQQVQDSNTTAKAEAEQARRRAGQSRGSSLQAREPSTRDLAFMIYPGGAVRGEEGETNKISFSSQVSHVILKLPLVEEDDYRSYRATLQADGRTVQIWRGLKSTVAKSGKVRVVALRIPTKLLRQQSYQVKLAGDATGVQIHDIATYSFEVK